MSQILLKRTAIGSWVAQPGIESNSEGREVRYYNQHRKRYLPVCQAARCDLDIVFPRATGDLCLRCATTERTQDIRLERKPLSILKQAFGEIKLDIEG